MFAYELELAGRRAQSPAGRVDDLPVEDDYSEDSFPEEDPDGDQAWHCLEMVAANELLGESRRHTRRLYRELECTVPSV